MPRCFEVRHRINLSTNPETNSINQRVLHWPIGTGVQKSFIARKKGCVSASSQYQQDDIVTDFEMFRSEISLEEILQGFENIMSESSRNCPYLDTINRSVLDFDFEKQCSVTLTHLNVYACLVCGRYFQGKKK